MPRLPHVIAVLLGLSCVSGCSPAPPAGVRVASYGTPPPPTGAPPSRLPPTPVPPPSHDSPLPPTTPSPPPASPAAPAPLPEPPIGPRDYRAPLGTPQLGADEPAMRYANLSSSACRQELARQGLPVDVPKKGYANVGLPVRVTGPFHGVVIRTASNKYGVLDCRLALALGAMAEVLAEHGVGEVRIGNIYRPRARISGRRRKSQHSYGLAADVSAFVTSEGDVIPVEGNWGAGIGERPCGPGAVMKTDDDRAHLMRDAVCDLSRRGVFHHILTPSANAAHRNHFHFDIERDAKNRWIR